MQIKNPRRLIKILAGLTLLLLPLWFLLNYSFLTITGTDTQKKDVYVVGDKFYKQLELTNKSESMLIKRGSYRIEVSSGDKLSLYNRKFGGMSKNTVNIELSDQKSSQYLGSSPLPCAQQAAENTSIFYSCGNDVLGIIANDKANAATPPDANPSGPISTVIKNYNDDFLEAKLSNNKLEIRAKNDSGYLAAKGAVVINDFQGEITDSYLGVSQDSDNFAVFDTRSKKLHVYKGLADKNPVIHELNDKQVDMLAYSTAVITGKNFTYLMNYGVVSDEVDVGSTVDNGESEYTSSNIKPRVLVYSHQENKLKTEHILPIKWQIRSLAEGPGDQVVFFLSGNLNNEAYRIAAGQKPEQLAIPTEVPQEACWKNSDSFYYLSDAGTKIYHYSQSKQAAFLVYGNLMEGTIIRGLHCAQGKVSFSIGNDKDGDTINHYHYTLGEAAHSLVRIESILPIYFDSGPKTYKAVTDKAGVKVQLIGSGGAVPNEVRDGIRSLVLERLEAKGASPANINIVF